MTGGGRRLGAIAALAVAGWIAGSGASAQTIGGVIGGERVETTEREAPAPIPTETARDAETTTPFGSNLFTGRFRAEREDGYNPSYVVQPGDQINLRLWGATAFEGLGVVDAQGNVFIPEVGPIRVAGVQNGALTEHLRKAIARVFTRNVEVYSFVAGTTPVIVYVAGYVKRPGSYAGVASDSLLYFLDRAGGIVAGTGSYRDVRVLRGGQAIARADLYRFLIDGRIPKVQFQDGDTVLVGRRGGTVAVDGAVRNSRTFELVPGEFTGAAVTAFARPLAGASHVALTGTRRGGPVSAYLPMAEFDALALGDGDRVVYQADEREDTMLVRVEGSHLGPSRFAVPRDATLKKVLDYIEVDPRLADIGAVSLRRRSIAERQKRALDDTLRRLEAAVLSATSQTDEESKIRAGEARLIADFVKRARAVEPDGVLVVVHGGEVQDVRLRREDVITIPERSEFVLVSGEVAVPQALVHRDGETADDYIARVGGYSNRADRGEILVIRRTGEVLRNRRGDIRPGDEIVVLPEVPVKNLQIAKTVMQTVFQAALSAGVVLGI